MSLERPHSEFKSRRAYCITQIGADVGLRVSPNQAIPVSSILTCSIVKLSNFESPAFRKDYRASATIVFVDYGSLYLIYRQIKDLSREFFIGLQGFGKADQYEYAKDGEKVVSFIISF